MSWVAELPYDPTTTMSMKTSLKNSSRILSNHFVVKLLKTRDFMLELKREGHARVQTEMVEFIALPFSSSSLVISRSRTGNGKKCTKKRDALIAF